MKRALDTVLLMLAGLAIWQAMHLGGAVCADLAGRHR